MAAPSRSALTMVGWRSASKRAHRRRPRRLPNACCRNAKRTNNTVTDKEHEIPVKVVDRRWWARGDDGDAPSSGISKPTYVEELERQLAEKDRIAQEYIAKYRQAAAEFDEARARLRREIGKEIERGRREILADLLEVVDNLDRAL